nr:ThiF family adenylyltransferase [Sporosalibacterium faouarense]
MLSPIIPGKTPCFRCFMPEPPSSGTIDTCDTIGVLNGITNIIASYQSTEALKILTQKTKNLIEGLLYIDIWDNNFEVVNPSKKSKCKACSDKNYEFLNRKDEDAVHLCGKNSIQINPLNKEVSVEHIMNKLKSIGVNPQVNSFFIRFEIDDIIFTLFYDGRAIIKNVTELNKAKSLYAQYIGY